jgi:hypothetical protein
MKQLFICLAAVSALFLFFACKSEARRQADADARIIHKEGDLITFVNPRTGESETFNLSEIIDGTDGLIAYRDSMAMESRKPTVYDPALAGMYFVAKWNTPSYTREAMWDGRLWDSHTFMGVEKDGYIYLMADVFLTSDRYLSKGDSVVKAEIMFPKDGVTQDPRKTCRWIASVVELNRDESLAANYVSIAKFLEQALDVAGNPTYQDYIRELSDQIKKTEGENNRLRILNYTTKVVPGSPDLWDAWNWPGFYYSDTEESKPADENRESKQM